MANGEQELSEEAAPAAGTSPPGPTRALSLRGLSRGRKIGIAVATGCLAALVLVSVLGPANGTTGKPTPPTPAKSLTLPALGRPGATLSLGQYRGRALLVNFFASWCVPCKKETPLLARFYREQHGRVAIIGVDVNDGASSAEKFTRAAGVAYPIGTDPTGLNATRWGVVAIPQTFFLNADHLVVKRIFGAVTQADLNAGLARMRAR